ncbi:hypothetical protein D3C78_1675000 [compost metagenome]
MRYTELETITTLEEILKHSFPGTISDPVSSPECISEHNIELVALAFIDLINEKKETSLNM